MGKAGVSASNLDQRKNLWDWIDTHHPELWDQPAPLKVSDRLIAEMARHLDVAPSRRARARASVRNWLNEPEAYTPYIDKVAIDRALAFDWDAIENLSAYETAEFYERLAGMDDPLSMDDEDRNIVTKELISASTRRYAFLYGTPKQRGMVQMGLDRARAKAVAA